MSLKEWKVSIDGLEFGPLVIYFSGDQISIERSYRFLVTSERPIQIEEFQQYTSLRLDSSSQPIPANIRRALDALDKYTKAKIYEKEGIIEKEEVKNDAV